MDEKRVSEWQPVGLDKSRLRAWLLVCKVLLHQLQLLSGFPYFSQLWLSFLVHTEKYMLHKHATELHKVRALLYECAKNWLILLRFHNPWLVLA